MILEGIGVAVSVVTLLLTRLDRQRDRQRDRREDVDVHVGLLELHEQLARWHDAAVATNQTVVEWADRTKPLTEISGEAMSVMAVVQTNAASGVIRLYRNGDPAFVNGPLARARRRLRPQETSHLRRLLEVYAPELAGSMDRALQERLTQLEELSDGLSGQSPRRADIEKVVDGEFLVSLNRSVEELGRVREQLRQYIAEHFPATDL